MKKMKEISAEELETTIKEKKIVVVDFSATWCGPCKSMGKVLDSKVVPKLKDDPEVALVKIDIDKNQQLAQALQVQGVPTMMFFFNGKRVMFQGEKGQEDRIVGFHPQIDQMVLAMVEQLKKTPVDAKETS
jgi:thioredoxin